MVQLWIAIGGAAGEGDGGEGAAVAVAATIED